jgi:hypothetical protein
VLHNDADITGELVDSLVFASDAVRLYFADGRHVTVKMTIDPGTT